MLGEISFNISPYVGEIQREITVALNRAMPNSSILLEITISKDPIDKIGEKPGEASSDDDSPAKSTSNTKLEESKFENHSTLEQSVYTLLFIFRIFIIFKMMSEEEILSNY